MPLKNAPLLVFLLLISTQMFAQLPDKPGPDSNWIPEFRMEQHREWLNEENPYPAKERNRWQIGVSGGMLRVSGDIRTEMGWGFSGYVRKALGYGLSLRMQYMRGRAYGLNWMPSTTPRNNNILNGTVDPAVDYYDENVGLGLLFHNFKTNMQDISFQGVYNLNNLKFHKGKNVVSLYFYGGAGVLFYETFLDQLDANGNTYDYLNNVPFISNDESIRDQNRAALKSLLDMEYETAAEKGPSLSKYRNWTLAPAGSVGLGVAFKLSHTFEIALEHKVSITDDDLIDGQRYQEPVEAFVNSNLSSNDDAYHFSTVNFNINLGSRHQDPDWWRNPMDFAYSNLAYLEKKTDFSDDDLDGVPNFMDKEPGTPEGAVVSPDGRTLDSDKDDIPDHLDPEPYSSHRYPIVEGITQWPEPVTEDQVIALIRDHGAEWWLPIIHFHLDKDYIRVEDFDNLRHVKTVLDRYPDMKVEVIGHTDIRQTDEYNIDLSRRRSENAIKFLVERLGVDKDRLIIKYEGEHNNFIKARNEAEHFINRRVEFTPVFKK